MAALESSPNDTFHLLVDDSSHQDPKPDNLSVSEAAILHSNNLNMKRRDTQQRNTKDIISSNNEKSVVTIDSRFETGYFNATLADNQKNDEFSHVSNRRTDDSAIWSDLSMDIVDNKRNLSRPNKTTPQFQKDGKNYYARCSLSLHCFDAHHHAKSCFCPWASVKMFCFLSCCLITVHGALATGYTFSVLTTIEKRFAINSVVSGLVISSYELGSLMSVVFVSYFGTHGNIPKWIGLGGISLSLGSLLFSFPHFIAPEYKPHNVNDSGPFICQADPSNIDSVVIQKHTSSGGILSIGLGGIIDYTPREEAASYVYWLVFAQIFLGAGGSPIFTLGTSYIDNHVEKDHAAIYLAFMYVMMAVGPICGFLLGALMLGEYVDPFKVPPKMQSTSPYWVGLWWGGYIICSILYLLSSLPFFVFPRRLQASKELSDKESEYGKTWKKIPASISNLLSNGVYLVTSFCACIALAIVSGFTTFLPKYIETQFNLSPSSASGLTGLVAIPGACFGIFFGGWIIRYLKLEMKGVANYVFIVNCVSLVLLTMFFGFGCDNVPIAGLNTHYDANGNIYDVMNLTSTCNQKCACRSSSKYSPICGSNNVTYVSPCHAGCNVAIATGKQRTDIVGDVSWNTHNYSECSCIPLTMDATSSNLSFSSTKYDSVFAQDMATAKEGICSSDCKMLAPFLILLFLISLAASNNQMPLVLTTLRSVSEEEKAFALGLQLVLVRLFGYIPSPMLYGAVIDSSCMLPSDSFVRRDQASCLLYDIKQFRYRFSIVSLSLMVLAFFLSLLLCWSVRKRYVPFSPPLTMSEIVLRLGDIENLHIRRSLIAGSLRSWVSDDSLYSRPRSPRHQKTLSC